MHKKILIIEDEPDIQEILEYTFSKEGFKVSCASSGEEGIDVFNKFKPNIILLDLMLPGIDGLEVCKILAKYDVPIIMLTARNDTIDKILGLELGADDYITKPFDIRECVTRVNVALRRVFRIKHLSEKHNQIYKIGEVQINIDERKVFISSSEVRLKPREMDLLLYFIINKNIALSREKILDSVWGYDYEGDDRTVDVHVRRLREKLKNNRIIETSFGVGYLFRGDLIED